MPGIMTNPDGTPHIHEFTRMRKTQTYRCTHPNCFGQYHKKLLLGKEALCGICHQEKIILGHEQLRRATPRCLSCSNTEEATIIRKRVAILRELGIS